MRIYKQTCTNAYAIYACVSDDLCTIQWVDIVDTTCRTLYVVGKTNPNCGDFWINDTTLVYTGKPVTYPPQPPTYNIVDPSTNEHKLITMHLL